jgi:hypothetical protein
VRVIGRYLYRFLKLWLFWFWAPVLDVLAFFADPYIAGFSFPKAVYWAIPILGFLAANVKLFAEVESEKRVLQDRINELEDVRADIRFKKTEDFCEISSPNENYPFSGPKPAIDRQTRLGQNGMPGWIVIGAELEGEKKSWEAGQLIWKITEVDLPPNFLLGDGNQGAFRWKKPGSLLTRIEDWRDDFKAGYEIPLEIAERDDACSFAQCLSSLGSYRVVVTYCTRRGIDNESRSHILVLEGDFHKLREELCKKWREGKFGELAQLAQC